MFSVALAHMHRRRYAYFNASKCICFHLHKRHTLTRYVNKVCDFLVMERTLKTWRQLEADRKDMHPCSAEVRISSALSGAEKRVESI